MTRSAAPPVANSLFGRSTQNGEWRMVNSEWRIVNGEWRMVNGEWTIGGAARISPFAIQHSPFRPSRVKKI
jgi:hypothetical protein